MYDAIIDITQECFLFTWFLMLVIGIINFMMFGLCLAKIGDKLTEVSEKWEAERAELRRALERRRGR